MSIYNVSREYLTKFPWCSVYVENGNGTFVSLTWGY